MHLDILNGQVKGCGLTNFVPKRQGVGQMGLFTLFAVAGFSLSALLAFVLHVLNPEFDPVTRAMSDYVHGHYGVLMVAGLVVSGLSMFALAASFRYIASSTQEQLGVILLAAAGVCSIMAGLFPSDNTPDGSFNTVPGAIHAVASFLLSPLLVGAMLCLLGHFRLAGDNQMLQCMATGMATLSAAAFAGLLFVNRVVRLPVGGIGQRIFIGLVWSWLLLASVRLLIVQLASENP